MTLELQANPNKNNCAYSPHNEVPESGVDDFYSTLRTTMEQIPKHNCFALAGDMNAKLSAPLVDFSFNETTKRNGEKLIDLMEEFNLFPSNNGFMKPKKSTLDIWETCTD